MKTLPPLLLVPLALLCGCSAEKPAYDPPKAIKRFNERSELLLAVDSTMATAPFNREAFLASLGTLRNPFVDFKEPVAPKVDDGPKVAPVVQKELTTEEIFEEAIALLGPRSILISPSTRILVTEEGSRRIGHVIEWADTEGREYKVTLVDIATGSYTLEYKGTKQLFKLRR